MAALVKHPAICCRPQQLPFKRGPTPVLKNLPRRCAPVVVCAAEDFDFRDGPREVTKPKFIRSEFPSLLEPVKPGSDASGTSRRKRRRPFRRASPLQAISGAVIGGGCSVVAFNVARQAYQHLETHPPAHDLPLNLTIEVNQLLLTMVGGFGGLVVCMFGVSSVGLGLLSMKLITTPKIPQTLHEATLGVYHRALNLLKILTQLQGMLYATACAAISVLGLQNFAIRMYSQFI